jgi:hypothetical protein
MLAIADSSDAESYSGDSGLSLKLGRDSFSDVMLVCWHACSSIKLDIDFDRHVSSRQKTSHAFHDACTTSCIYQSIR